MGTQKHLATFFFLIPLFMTTISSSPAQQPVSIQLWPGKVPQETQPKAADVISDDHSREVTRVARVTDPVIEVFEPKDADKNGTGVIICPGGGYNILAIDLEGYDVARWLNSLGITAFVLHYRVPENPAGALADAQRAIRLVRDKFTHHAPYLKKIGILGFSAGASLSAMVGTRYADSLYEPVDQADEISARPDFAMLIYPAYLDNGKGRSLTPELKPDAQTPPMFIFGTADDQFGNSALVMAGALRDQQVSVELHVLPEGGHGYGVRPGNPAAEAWPVLAEKWLNKNILSR